MIRLGASVQENALATLTDLLGDPTAVDHKPARADIQKYKKAYDLYHAGRMQEGEKERSSISPGAIAAQEWDDKYGLSKTEQRIVEEYKMSWQVLDEDPQRAFTQTIKILRADNDLGLHGLDDQELKRLVGSTLKKYEQQNYPMLYEAIEHALNDAYRRGPYESYKMWPRLVQWIKDRFEAYLWVLNGSYNPRNQSWTKLEEVTHLVDIATEGGALLSKLRAENKLPTNFDANQLTASEFEQWLMDWKKENLASEKAGEVVYEFHNGWTIQKLNTPESLQFEGDEMGHCVGGYHHQVEDGSSIIYSLRDQKGEPHVTMEIEGMEAYRRPDQDGEMQGYDNVEEALRENGINAYEPPHDPHPHIMEMISPTDHEPGQHTQQISNHDPSEENDYGWGKTGEKAFQIVQVQGRGNKTPKPEYQAMIKEFLDALRTKGWNFERSENWYGNWDDGYADGYDPEYPEKIDDARSLDDWWDDHYLTQHGLYRTQKGKQDAYGLALPDERMKPAVSDWSNVLTSIASSLIEDYDQSKFRTNWYTPAQQVYHAWVSDMSKDDPDEQYLAQETRNFEREIEHVEGEINEWENENEYYALNDENMRGEIAEKLKEQMEKKGEWAAFMKQVEAEHGPLEDPDFDEYEAGDILIEAQEYDPDLYYEIIHEEVNKYYSADAYKFTQYLYMLVQKHGMVGPNDLPDPNERHGGLPSYDDLLEMPWKSEVNRQPTEPEIPGTFSHWYEGKVGDHRCSYPSCGDPATQWIGQTDDPSSYVGMCDSHAGRYQRGEKDLPKWLRPKVAADSKTITQPRRFVASADDIQIYPIDQERNIYLDEDGNQVRRWRPGWVKNPETGKMEESGDLEDSFFDNLGRQGQGYAAYHGDNPVASLTYVNDPAGWTMLGTAYTHPDYRQQGLFNRLAQPLRDSGRPIDAYVWNNPWLKNKVRDWRKPKSSKLGFFKVAADINELAQNAINNLMAREDLVAMQVRWFDQNGSPVTGTTSDNPEVLREWINNGYTQNPKYNGRLYGIIKQALGQMPPELYKFFPWLVKQFKNGLLDRVPNNHIRDILTQAWQHMEYLRSQPPNSPNAGQLPDINQLDWPALEAWVYQRNALGIDVRPGYQWDYTENYYQQPDRPEEQYYPHEPQGKKWDVGDGWQVWPVWTENDLKQEGDMMGHCVGGYCQGVHSGSSAIFSLRDPKGEPHATIELEPEGDGNFNVIQVQGKQNSEPSDEYKARIADFFRDLQLAGHHVTWTILVNSAYDLDDYEYISPPSESYGIPISIDIDLDNVCREMMDDAETGSTTHMEGLDKLINDGLISYQDVKYLMQVNGESLIEDKARDLTAEWEDKKRELQRLYETELSDHIDENHDLEDEDADSEDTYGFPEFEEWLETNYPDEYQQEYYGFTDAAEDELPEVVELMQRFGSVTWRAIA